MMEDYRTIPVEVLRDFARTHSEITSIRATAEEVGVSHSALHKFIQGQTNPQPRVKRLLGLWYLAKRSEAPDIDVVRPYSAALAILLSTLPDVYHTTARAEAVDALRSIYERCEAPVPRWLELLAARQQPHWMERAHR
jgi:hypothetical protein